MLSNAIIEVFDADGVGVANGAFFGFPFSAADCDLVLMKVKWDATVSYGEGAANGPDEIVDASTQVEIFDANYIDAWKKGIATLDPIQFAIDNNTKTRQLARQVIENAENGGAILSEESQVEILKEVNEASRKLNFEVYKQAKEQLSGSKIVGLVGGDHSTPLGLMQAIGEKTQYGILHIDAHADLRDAYEGFEFSHASIMRNALKIDNVKKLVQVGIRDFSREEAEFAKNNGRIQQFTDNDINKSRFEGDLWSVICDKIVESLPDNVYVSFDIDGLQQQFCPSTGTPVPGGVSYSEAVYLLKKLHLSGKKIVGFDLTEVASGLAGQWDANVGARVLYNLCNVALA